MIRHTTILSHGQEWLHTDHLSGQDLFPLLRHTTLLVRSWSMFPTLRKGDQIELDQACHIRVDDILVYRQAGALVCHRVNALGPDGLIITGSEDVDQGTDAVAARDIVGRVTSIRRGHCRLSSAKAMPPTPFASLYRCLDQGQLFISSLLRSSAIAIVDRLRARRVTGRLLSGVFMSCLRFHITERMPIVSIPLYDKRCTSIWSRGPRRTRTLIHQLNPVNRLVIEAYLGPYAVGSLNPLSGDQHVHPSLGGLGLELYFADLLQRGPASRA